MRTMAPLVGEKPDLRVLGWSVRQNKVLGITSPQNLSLRTTFIPISSRKAIEELAISQGNWSPKTPAESGSEVGWVVSKISSHLCQASAVRWEEGSPVRWMQSTLLTQSSNTDRVQRYSREWIQTKL